MFREDFDPIVIRPHERELDLVAIFRVEESVVDRPFKERTVVIVIPVKKEHVDAILRSGVDLLFHVARIRLVGIAPKRNLRLLMTFKSRFGILDKLPLRPAFAKALFIAFIKMVVAEIVGNDLDIVGLRVLGIGGDDAIRQRDKRQ